MIEIGLKHTSELTVTEVQGGCLLWRYVAWRRYTPQIHCWQGTVHVKTWV